MSTIPEKQMELNGALLAVKIPEDMSDWNMEDWTIFALDYLMANLDDALEGLGDDEWEFLADDELFDGYYSMKDALEGQARLKEHEGYTRFETPQVKGYEEN